MSKSTDGFFNQDVAKSYDERNRKLSAISDCLHFLMTLILPRLPTRARVLCVGVGTGAEISSLSRVFPEWRFVALEPSLPMLDECRRRLAEEGVSDRCEFVHGYVEDIENVPAFDAVLSILVAHFIPRRDRQNFFKQMTARLKPSGYLVNAEISFDLNSPEFPLMLKNWEGVQRLMGATPESLAKLPQALKEVLAILPPDETEDLFRQSGISLPVRFFQAFMICGWYGIKS